MTRWLAALSLVAIVSAPAAADPTCGAVEVRFAPGAPNLQIAVWIEDAQGNYIDTLYLTRSTGQFGLANRPGAALLKTDFRWPYGRREMVLPVWAHRRNHHYPRIVMGGVCGNSPSAMCPDGSQCSGDCVDSTIAYHSRVSSYEPFYCSPSGPSKVDALSCASPFTGSKGAFVMPPAQLSGCNDPSCYSLYPPRADLMSFDARDSDQAKQFAGLNDMVAVSRATPSSGALLDPPVAYFPSSLPDGDYVAWVELSQESDFNTSHNHPNQPDSVSTWDFEGHAFLGQPSVVYSVPFHYNPTGWSAVSTSYAGYGAWDGSTGTLNPPDSTITDSPGSGAGRLLSVSDGTDTFRVKVVVGGCADSDGGVGDGGMVCSAPDPVTNLSVAPQPTELDVTFNTPTSGVQPNRLAVRYRSGSTPITDADFDMALAAPDVPMPGAPGGKVQTAIHGVLPSTTYTVAARGISPCGKPSTVMSVTAQTSAIQYATLHGCFIATAAYGSSMERSVSTLREFRDARLLRTAAGKLFVTVYYAFSPPLASAIAKSPFLRATARTLLAPLVALAR